MEDKSTYFGREGDNTRVKRKSVTPLALTVIFGLGSAVGFATYFFPGRSKSDLQRDTNTVREMIEKYDSNRNGELEEKEILRAFRDKYIKR